MCSAALEWPSGPGCLSGDGGREQQPNQHGQWVERDRRETGRVERDEKGIELLDRYFAEWDFKKLVKQTEDII